MRTTRRNLSDSNHWGCMSIGHLFPRERGRSDFGLPADKRLYACLQSLFKFHPDYDIILADILRGDPQGVLVLPAGECSHWSNHWRELLIQRFRSSMPDVLHRIHWLPWQRHEDYLQLTSLVDVLLV